MTFENAIVVINKTRLESLIERFNTRAQARFYIEHCGGDFQDYEDEHETFHRSLDKVVSTLQRRLRTKVIDRKFVPNFLFSENDMVVVIGQDGLVANTAKYVGELPILAINPDPGRYDGVLLPFNLENYKTGLQQVLNLSGKVRLVTLAEARTNDGQRLLAFNDLFIGPASHTSARYSITYKGETERQSSSGVIVSTAAGCTGWLSSVINMANGVTRVLGDAPGQPVTPFTMAWVTPAALFVVREPFQSKSSGINLAAGLVTDSDKLVIESHMPSNGVIFSDGIEADFIRFNSGMRVEIGIAKQRARLVTNLFSQPQA